MNEEKLNKMVDDIYLLFPLFRKKLFKRGSNKGYIPRSYYHVLKVLQKRGELPMSKIGSRIHISKSNMTSLIDKLAEKGFVERIPDKNDRRVIKIAMTDKGNNLLRDWREKSNIEIKKNLSTLSNEDLEKLYDSVENIKEILMKLET